MNEEQNLSADSKRRFSISIKTAALVLIALAIGFALYYYRGLLVAATVNGNPISRLSVINELEGRSGKAALDSLIIKKLINDEFAAKNLSINDGDVDSKVKEIEDQLKVQGQTLESALSAEGMSKNALREQIRIQLKLEKLAEAEVNISDEDVNKYIEENKIPIEKDKGAETKNQIKEQLRQQKLQEVIPTIIQNLKSQAKINYIVNY